MIKKIFKLLSPATVFFLFVVSKVLAQGGGTNSGGLGGGTNPGGQGGATNNGDCDSTFCIENPFNVGGGLYELLQKVVNDIILPIGGVLAVLAFIFAGFLYVTAQGNETKIKKAHNALLYAAIGTALLLGAWTFANVIRNTVNDIITK
mgnify:CR=1 FL=1